MAYDNPLRRVLDIMGPTALSRELGIVPSAITQWDKVPAKWLLKVSGLTGIPAEELRPDLAPEEKPADAAQARPQPPSDSPAAQPEAA